MKNGIGIDFGTTNSIVSIYKTNLKTTNPLTNRETNLPHPSVIWYRADGSIIVGVEAKNNIIGFSDVEGNRFIYSIKRRLGKGESIDLFGNKIPVFEIASDIFGFLKKDAELRDSEYNIDEAVVTIPIYFNGYARRELRKAANNAGIYIKKFIHEPFAAIVGHCHKEGRGLLIDQMEGQIIMVFDWGGGTLDITIAQVENGEISELSTAGIEDRAGDYFDDKLVRFSKSSFLNRLMIPTEDFQILPSDLDRLRMECEGKKIILSSEEEAQIQIAGICKYKEKYQDMDEYITRDNFEKLIHNDVRDALSEINRALETAGLTARELDKVLLIGGTSRIPYVRHQLREMFGHRIVEIQNANTIIADGAAIIDATGLEPVLARSLNIELSDGSLYEVFGAGLIAHPDICHKDVNFFCTDNRDGQAKLVLKEMTGRIDAKKKLTKEILSIPVSPEMPKPYNHERVTVKYALDEDMVLHVSGKGATQKEGTNCQIFDLCFGLRLEGTRE